MTYYPPLGAIAGHTPPAAISAQLHHPIIPLPDNMAYYVPVRTLRNTTANPPLTIIEKKHIHRTLPNVETVRARAERH
jgi:hypothetical protein